VTQTDTSNTVHLGSFKKYEHGYRVMVFEQGDLCPGGPHRSVKVFMECGQEEKILHIEEPQRCVYSIGLSTPTVCEILPRDREWFERLGDEEKQGLWPFDDDDDDEEEEGYYRGDL
jgi:Glucosidase II beta subunit-like protein